jgi:hypothetical protein
MLSLLFYQTLITFTCLWSGLVFYNFFPSKNKQSPLYCLISGLIILSAFAQIIAIFFPINIYSKLTILGVLILLSFYKRKSITLGIPKLRSSVSVILFLICWAIILVINAGPLVMDDTESYHIQSIKWIQQYGSVPGLVNLHERFGFNSSWFSSVALFSFLPHTTGGFTVLNSVFSLWLCYWIITTYNSEQTKNNGHAALAILVILTCSLIVWPLLRGNAATTNYDFVTTCIVFILFIEIFLSENHLPSIEWIIWPAYLFTVRIINFPVLLLSVFAVVYFIRHKNGKALLLPIACGLLLIIPFIIRNIIIAGFPFYPSSSFDVTNVDWKPDPQMTERLVEYIKYYNRVSTTYLDIEQTKALGSNWLPWWFTYLFLFDKVLVIGGITGILLSVVRSFIQKSNPTILLGAISLVWLICWLFISPDPRFVYGIFLSGIFLFAYHLFSLVPDLHLLKIFGNVLVIAMITGSSYYFISKLWKQEEYRNIMFPLRLPEPPTKSFVIGEITFRIPDPINNNWNARCYGTSLPCLYRIDPRLKPRGKDIRDGFRLEK